MSEKDIKFPKDDHWALDKFSDQVGTREAGIGPLKTLDTTATDSIAVYERGLAPSPSVEVILDGGAAPDGYDQICKGTAWILGQKQPVMAIRKK